MEEETVHKYSKREGGCVGVSGVGDNVRKRRLVKKVICYQL